MAKPRVIVLVCFCTATLLSGLTLAADFERPSRFLPNLDGQLVRATNPLDGSSWAAWTYANGSETDIAISRREAGGAWSEPRLVGLNDLESQRQPALAIDAYGTTYLAYAERGAGRVFVMALGLDARDWTTPAAITPSGVRGTAPALMIAANRKLVIAYVVDGRAGLRQFELLSPVILGNGNDGPDPLGNHMWPPESEDDNPDSHDGVIDSNAGNADLEFTAPSRRRSGRE